MAQSEVDAELWAGGKVNVSIKKRWRFEAEYQQRWENNISTRKVTFQEFALRYKVAKWFLVKPSFRIVQAPQLNDDWNRASLDLCVRNRKQGSPFRFSIRLKGQYNYGVNKAVRHVGLRNRFSLSYDTGKLVDPSISFEVFDKSLRFEPIGLQPSDTRLKLGVDWHISKQWSLNTFYGLEQQVGRKTNNKEHIIGVLGVWKMKVKKKKVKDE